MSIRLIIFTGLLLLAIFLEQTFLTISLSFLLVFSLALYVTRPERFIVVFLGGLFYDLIGMGIFPLVTIFFLGMIFLIGLYKTFLPLNFIARFFFFFLFSFIFTRITNIYPSFLFFLIHFLLFIPVWLFTAFYLKPLEEPVLGFDLFCKHGAI